MHPIPKLKLNKFVDAAIPKPRVLFARYGYASSANRNMTGDDFQPLRESKEATLNRLNKEVFENE